MPVSLDLIVVDISFAKLFQTRVFNLVTQRERSSKSVRGVRYCSARYCDARCQKKDWPKHKRSCEVHSFQTMVAEADELDPDQMATLSMQAVYPLLMTSAPGISAKTKARAAFRVVSAEVVPSSEFRTAAADRGHRMYYRDTKAVVQDFDRYFGDAVSSGRTLHPNRCLCMVVQSIDFNNGVTAMVLTKNWYPERDSKKNYSRQWRPPTDDWLDFLKTTVAAGKAWDRDDVHISSNPGTLVSSRLGGCFSGSLRVVRV
ncbi:hypothetical protein DFH08DRAFT_796653 [Mycena albidolilacea]|uniref:MYND-type domain-containing protein n=1 Tax=Mycena albidolilacea TaxID=1033008 RepID=A0AAD7AVI6_9AGAR|nr:hypothetical protein DFH08DRAFT_796653 [Mycena albidolilacea]